VTLNPAHLKAVRKAMYEVSNARNGTAYRSRVIDEAFRMAGKTGTSQVFTISEAERKKGVTSNEDRDWERRDHALFVCFAPYDDPKIAVSVVVEHGGGGSTTAAPIARDILLQALYNGTPPLTAYPVKDRATISKQQTQFKEILPRLKSGENVET
jgi:penicillin-binding protein 2